MKRRGISLLEMSVVISLLTVLMVGAATLLTSLIIHIGRQRTTYHEAQVATRLAAALRRDVREAMAIEMTDGAEKPAQLHLTLPNETAVAYQAVEQGVERTLRAGPQIRQRELYRLADLHELHFERSAGPQRPVVCVWTRRWHGPQPVEQDEAALRDHRILAAPRREVGDE